MNKDQFYTTRILWKAKKNFLLSQRCTIFSDLPCESQAEILLQLPRSEDLPIIAFFDSHDLWTVLTSNKIYSYHGHTLQSYLLDEIHKDIALIDNRDIKSGCYLKIDNRIIVWAPEGKEIFGLWNLLLMFPLGLPQEIGFKSH